MYVVGNTNGIQFFTTETLFTGAGGASVGVGVNVGVGEGVGVGGTGYSGKFAVLPLTVAYCPQSQQVPDPFRRLTTQ